MARSTYYYYLKQDNGSKYAEAKAAIVSICERNKQRYGYRRVTAVLRQQGYGLNHKTVLKLMKNLGLRGKQYKNKYRSYKGEIGKVAPNILARDCKATKPYEKLVTDVTEFAVCEDKVYFSPIMDLYNREILSYNISLSANFEQTKAMLKGLFEKMPNEAKPILDSDQGWQYQHRLYQEELQEHGITQSMSRKGNCLDNSAMENLFGRLKTEMFYGEKFQTRIHPLSGTVHLLPQQRENISQTKSNEPGTIPNSLQTI